MPDPTPSLNACLVFLGVAAAVYLLLVGGAQILRRGRGVRFGRIYHAFAAVAGATTGLSVAPWESPWRSALLHHLEAATFLLTAFPLVVLLNRALWVRTSSDGETVNAPRLLADITRLVALLVALLVVLQFFYGVKVPGLLTGSGVAAIILGLAMQDLLGNVLAGFVLHVAKPFKTGDWLLVDGYHARVVELTSRSTRLLTPDEVILDLPNSILVKRAVVNFSQPNPRHAVRATMGLDYDLPPARARAILLEATGGVPSVCARPPPSVVVKEFAATAIVYEITVWIEDHALQGPVLSDVYTHCWYALRRLGLELPFPSLTLPRNKLAVSGEAALAAAAAALRAHAVFGFLTAEQVEALVRQCPVVLFAPAERLVVQEAAADSMFLLVRGSVEVQVRRGGRSSVVTRLGPGDCLGEMSLLTGEPRSATVVASEEVEAVEITKAAFASLVRGNPEVLARLGELLAQRQLANQVATAAEAVELPEQARASVLRRLRSFFNLTN
jgi:small-conductance mechanosensitive channel/CRP-like cAMP-binding protein